MTATQEAVSIAPALRLIDEVVAKEMQERGVPGLALAITDRDGLLAARNFGYADLAAQTPVTDETLFEFGSIGKSFTAICLLQLADAGVVDLDVPVTRYLPWFSVRSRYEPITIHHLLTHTAGIIGGSDFSPDQRFEVWALHDTNAAPPGKRARYSNLGYKTLGLVLEAVTGKPYAQMVRERIFAPLGMTQSAGAITHEMRRRLAVGYVPFYDDRPLRRGHGLASATWLETDTGDGWLSATATDLAAYLRMLLNEGVGQEGRLLTAESFARMTTPHTAFEEGEPYGYGLALGEKDGRRTISHTGGMVGYVSAMSGDRDAGIGVVILTNAMRTVRDLADFALRAAVAAAAGEPLPEPPAAEIETDFAPYAGVYQGAKATLTVKHDDGRLVLVRDGERIPLEPMPLSSSPGVFLADHPDFALFPLRFGRDETESMVELSHGGDWYAGEAYTGPTAFTTPPAWDAHPGHYRGHNPWDSNFRVALRKGKLLLIYASGHEEALTPDSDGFRIGDDEETPERISFDTVVDGLALRARRAGGADFYRFFTP